MGDPNAAERIRAAVRSIGVHAREANLDRSAALDAFYAAAVAGRLIKSEQHAAADTAHQLVGSAGTFGFPVVSDLAAELEEFFTDGAFDDSERVAVAGDQLKRLRAELSAEPVYLDGAG